MASQQRPGILGLLCVFRARGYSRPIIVGGMTATVYLCLWQLTIGLMPGRC
jgi:hypothetical protein